jgi:hypothetical protein
MTCKAPSRQYSTYDRSILFHHSEYNFIAAGFGSMQTLYAVHATSMQDGWRSLRSFVDKTTFEADAVGSARVAAGTSSGLAANGP